MVARRAHNPEVVGSSPASATNSGEMAEWSIAAVLKTAEGHTSGGSNPSLSAQRIEGQTTKVVPRTYLRTGVKNP